jgi:hypothetical protein
MDTPHVILSFVIKVYIFHHVKLQHVRHGSLIKSDIFGDVKLIKLDSST